MLVNQQLLSSNLHAAHGLSAVLIINFRPHYYQYVPLIQGYEATLGSKSGRNLVMGKVDN